ncbi:MAG: hypothetical protein JWP69_40 [Flaviaesturariibacter sp.]|nr:hypothetical protein [Flaviaesturariibacter sp.]
MEDYRINVSDIEELQNIGNRDALDAIFVKAKSAIVNGEATILFRKFGDAHSEVFNVITTLEDLENYQKEVYKYL